MRAEDVFGPGRAVARAGVAAVLTLTLAGSAAAQGLDLRLGMGPSFPFDDLFTGGHVAASLGYAPAPGFIAARLGLYAGHNTRPLRDPNRPETLTARYAGDGTVFIGGSLGGELRWKQGPIRPYLLVGLGYYWWSGWSSDHRLRTGLDIGLGMEMPMGGRTWFVEVVPRLARSRASNPLLVGPLGGGRFTTTEAVLPITFGIRF